MKKPQPNHLRYLESLSRMTPSERAAKAFELSASARRSFADGLRRRFPELSDAERHSLMLEQLKRCHNSNY